MTILADNKQDIPVTVTLKAETLMQFMVMAAASPQIPAEEMIKMKDAFTKSLGI